MKHITVTLLLLFCLLLVIGLFSYRLWLLKRPPGLLFTYKTAGEAVLQLHAYVPRGAAPAGGYPALLLFHGGGWTVGSARQFFPQCRVFSRAGIYCFSADYRVASRHGSSPRDALIDAKDALAWLQREAPRLGIDPALIFAGGGSSGGHLAALLGIPTESGATVPRALMLYNPILDLSPGLQGHARVASYWRELSPLHQLRQGGSAALIMSGSADEEVAVETLQTYCGAQQQLGTDCRLQLYAGAAHGFFNPGVDDNDYFSQTNELLLSYLFGIVQQDTSHHD